MTRSRACRRSPKADHPPSSFSATFPSGSPTPRHGGTSVGRKRPATRRFSTSQDNCREHGKQAKAELISRLAADHERIIAFDRHPITLAAIKPLDPGRRGARAARPPDHTSRARSAYGRPWLPGSTERGIALCSDAMNEGLNLQGADVVIHLDLPTTLRVAEQRVGRVDRMDSPYDQIHSWWPDDGPAFATRANELLAERNAESAALLGSNLIVPEEVQRRDEPIDVIELADRATSPRDEFWDGIRDALDPVRHLVHGRPVTRSISPIRGRAHQAEQGHGPRQPRHFDRSHGRSSRSEGTSRARRAGSSWREPARSRSLISPTSQTACATICSLTRHPEDSTPHVTRGSSTFLTAATAAELQLLPRRLQRALIQMAVHCGRWSNDAARYGRHRHRDTMDPDPASSPTRPCPSSQSTCTYSPSPGWNLSTLFASRHGPPDGGPRATRSSRTSTPC